jgi:hypothetical protein
MLIATYSVHSECDACYRRQALREMQHRLAVSKIRLIAVGSAPPNELRLWYEMRSANTKVSKWIACVEVQRVSLKYNNLRGEHCGKSEWAKGPMRYGRNTIV